MCEACDTNLKAEKDESCTSKVLSFIVLAPLLGSLMLWLMIGFEFGLKWLYGAFSQNETLLLIMNGLGRILNTFFPFTVSESNNAFMLMYPKLYLPLFLIVAFMSFILMLTLSIRIIFKKFSNKPK